jgi:iron complex outermembrane receptor protein
MNKGARVFVVRTMPLLIAAAYAGGALAQEKIEEVIVTAQKRQERLQDVPISISAITASQLETRGIEGAKDLNSMAPNVVVKAASPSGGLIAATAIRGMNTGQPAIWADPSVGMYIDGVFVGKNQGALFDVVDLERVEILRGPQGTLFGRNTEGGAINMITRKPSGEFSGSVGVDIGNYNRHVERVSMDLPKMGILRASFALRNEKRDGIVDNPNGGKWDNRDRQAGRVALGLDITPAFKIDYAYDHSKIDERPTAVTLLSAIGYNSLYTAPSVNGPFSPNSSFHNGLPKALQVTPPNFAIPGASPAIASTMAPYVQSGYPGSVTGDPGKAFYNRLKVDGHALTASYQLDNSNTLKYIGSYRKMRYEDNTDLDGTPNNVFTAGKDTHYKSDSHELQWIGNTDRMNYVLGAYLFKEDGNTLTFQNGSFFTFIPGVIAYRQNYYRIRTDASAIYGQVDYKLTDSLTATLGLRHTSEKKKGDLWRTNTNANFDPPGSPGVTYQAGFTPQGADATFKANTPVFALAYKVNEGLNVYGRVARGFKSGSFSLEAPYSAATNTGPLNPYQPEKSTSYEAGVKTIFLGGKAQFNAAVFRTNVDDWHVSLLPPGTTSPVNVNAGKAQTQGIELESVFQVADGWRLTAGYGYLDAKYKKYMAYNQLGTLVDVAGNTTVGYAPKQQLTLNVDGRLARTSFGTLRGIVDYVYTSEYYNYSGERTAVGPNVSVANSAEESRMPALGLVNLRLLLAGIPIGGPGKADASLWVRNATNLKKEVAHIDLGGYYRIATYSEPRTFGLALNYKW